MGHDCCPAPTPSTDISYRRVLWIALFANLAMFGVELVASVWSGSSALGNGVGGSGALGPPG